MLAQRLALTREITQQLVEIERAIDDVMARQAQLQITLVGARRIANVALDAGEVAIDSVARAGVDLAAARKALHLAHYDLRAVRDRLRLPAHAYGDSGDTPGAFEPTGIAAARPVLAIAEAA